MFEIPKRKAEPLRSFEFENSTVIGKPAAEVYALLDWADPCNAKRRLGNKIERIGSMPDRFQLWLDLVPDHRLEMTVTGAMRGHSYAFESEITPPIGRLVSSHETYTIDGLGDGACRIGLKVSASFVGGLSNEELAIEVTTMAVSCENALAKLKVQAELGVDAVHAIEAMQMDCAAD